MSLTIPPWRCATAGTAMMLLAVSANCLAPMRTAGAQRPVPVRDLSAPGATSVQTFANIFGIMPLQGGGILVNDGLRRQLVMLDAALSHPRIVLDSNAMTGGGYGPRASPLIPFIADSSLFVDGQAGALLVIDPAGRIVRTMAAPAANIMSSLAASTSGTDRRANLVYRVPTVPIAVRTRGSDDSQVTTMEPPDSAPIIRANFETRRADTVASVKQVKRMRTALTISSTGARELAVTINPLETMDEWAILTDGSIAIVRGFDYHIDWIRANGMHESTPKIPFDWKPISEGDKQRMLDSVVGVSENIRASAATLGANGVTEALRNMVIAARPVLSGAAPSQPDIPKPAAQGSSASGDIHIGVVKPSDLPDYYPPIRTGALKADADGNMWILPSTSAQSKSGELVYDVVNTKGVLFQRVRLPAGRSIAGFGPGGVVFLMTRDAQGEWILERTSL